MSFSKTKEREPVTVEPDFFEVLMAAVGPESFNMAAYKKMAHFTSGTRTVSSFEHFFRNYKKKAYAMLAAEAKNNDDNQLAPANKPRKRKGADVTEAGEENSEVFETGSMMTRKRKAATTQESEEPSEPAAKKVKTEAEDDA
ncbi:MAG: hypothetical protein Q9195_001965 [Heterodermia aff. obscurata]